MKKPYVVLLILFILSTVVFSANYIYTHNINNPPIRSDGYGYYSYLPSIIINHDLSFESLAQKPDGYIYPETNKFLNKYTIGTAILQIPFFLIAHLLTLFQGLKADGFSTLYQNANIISAFFYFIIGLFFLHRLLILKINAALANITVLITVYGTNLFHYVTYDASFSHIYSFCMITIFLYIVTALNGRETVFKHIMIGSFLGIITMIKVTNILIVIFYLLYEVKSFTDFKRKFLTLYNYKYYFIALAAFCFVFLPQALYWYSITGHFIVNSYQKEGFNWLNPQLFNFLFSMQKGLFFWTPLWLISIWGVCKARKSDPNIFLPLVTFLLLGIYVCSSWWCWDYGGSFGQRPFTDFASVFALGFAIVIKQVSETRLIVVHGDNLMTIHLLPVFLIFILPFVIVNILSMVGYWYRVIPYSNTNFQDIKNLIKWYLPK